MIGKLIAAFVGNRVGGSVAKNTEKGGALGTVAGLAAYRIASRSLPGAALVGAAALGMRYYKNRRNRGKTTR